MYSFRWPSEQSSRRSEAISERSETITEQPEGMPGAHAEASERNMPLWQSGEGEGHGEGAPSLQPSHGAGTRSVAGAVHAVRPEERGL